jgi:DNA polymerase III epsilon subunit-like protein
MIDSDRLWIMVDLETSGPIIGTHSLTELGAAVGSKARGVIDRFEVLIAPIGDAVKTSPRSFARARAAGVSPPDGMARFLTWSRPYLDRASFIARPAAFDWPWIVQYAWRYLDDNPFGFKAICASSWLEATGGSFRGVKLPHVAVQDAEIQLRHFLACA